MADEGPTPGGRTIMVPEFFVNGVITSTDGKDFQLLFTKRPVEFPLPDSPAVEPSVVLNMSRGTAADLAHSLTNILDQLNKPFGPVDTPYLQEMAAKAKK